MPPDGDAPRPLAGLRVLVTRPRAQAETLAAAVAAAGGQPICFPAIAIGPPPDLVAARAGLARAGEHALAIFVSANAVEGAVRIAGSLAQPPAWPPAVAVGAATARSLERHGLGPAIAPRERYDSEAVLALEPLGASAVAGRSILLVRGEGGRELLAHTLARRGAHVTEVVVYQRRLPEDDPSPLREALAARRIDAVVVTSVEAARNLFALAGEPGAQRLRELEFVAIGERIAAALERLGVVHPARIAARAEDAALVGALAQTRTLGAVG